MDIRVANLSSRTPVKTLRTLFERFGEVARIAILSGSFTGSSSAVGIVEMPSAGEGGAAITGLNGLAVDGQTLAVCEAKHRDHHSDSRYSDGSSRSDRGKRKSTR